MSQKDEACLVVNDERAYESKAEGETADIFYACDCFICRKKWDSMI